MNPKRPQIRKHIARDFRYCMTVPEGQPLCYRREGDLRKGSPAPGAPVMPKRVTMDRKPQASKKRGRRVIHGAR
jgi:hypothetical protein